MEDAFSVPFILSWFVLIVISCGICGCINPANQATHTKKGWGWIGAHIQLFRQRLSEKVHATIPKGIVGGFEGTFLQRNLEKWHGRPWTYVCEY